MGCCLSLFPRDPDDSTFAAEVTQERHVDSSRVINSEPASLRHPSSASPNGQNVVHQSHSSRTLFQQATPPLPLSEHYNQPIRPHVWRSKRRTWTPTQLAREREEFFDTRVTGRPEVWAALRAAMSLLREGDVDTAQGIVDAAGVTVPTGDLCEGCYDENGALYRLPQCIVSDPENVVADSTTGGDHGAATTDFDGDGLSDRKLTMAEESEEELIPEDAERRREEKGKMSERDVIKVRCRLSDRGGPDLTVTVGKTQSVGVLARKIQSEARISGKQRVRIAYLGRMLREHEPLLEQGWKQGNVVNALVVMQPSSS